jgi:hypothetical protein
MSQTNVVTGRPSNVQLPYGELVTVQLKFATPRMFPNQFGTGERAMYTLTDARTLWLPDYAANQVSELNAGAGDEITIMKQKRFVTEGGRKKIDPTPPFVIERLQRQVEKKTAPSGGDQAAPNSEISQRNALTNTSKVTANATHTQAENDATAVMMDLLARMKAVNIPVMSGCLCMAIDVTQHVEKYAEAKGLKLEFNEEDIRAIGTSFFIETNRRLQLNGGAAWSGR